MHIITHRGLDPDISCFPAESTYEAFAAHLHRGFGIEFDVNFSRDNRIFIFHDDSLERIAGRQDKRRFSELELKEIKKIKIKNHSFCTLEEILDLIQKSEKSVSALHLKGKFQVRKYLDILIDHLRGQEAAFSRLLVFDTKIETARYLKESLPALPLSPSAAHPYDIIRYNECAGKTLIPLESALANKNLFNWVWLDEWDLLDKGGLKTLYNRENFIRLKEVGYKIAVVSPELHATSPGLLGGEAHADAASKDGLSARWKEIIELKPDAICTDHPDLVKSLL